MEDSARAPTMHAGGYHTPPRRSFGAAGAWFRGAG
jgi:hypothetical protein